MQEVPIGGPNRRSQSEVPIGGPNRRSQSEVPIGGPNRRSQSEVPIGGPNRRSQSEIPIGGPNRRSRSEVLIGGPDRRFGSLCDPKTSAYQGTTCVSDFPIQQPKCHPGREVVYEFCYCHYQSLYVIVCSCVCSIYTFVCFICTVLMRPRRLKH